MATLKIDSVSKTFGSHPALLDISLTVDAGERLALIGPNGAGKSALLNIITGTLQPNSGTLMLNSRDITRANPALRARSGIARTLQRSSIFPQLSCYESVLAAVQRGQAWLRTPCASQTKAYELLKQVGLIDCANDIAEHLAYGEKRLLEIAMALGTEPAVLLMDEPMAGLDQNDRTAITKLITELENVSLMIVEHNMDAVFEIADRIAVLHQGRIVALDTPEEIQNNSQVQKIYLGHGDVVA